MTSTSQRTQREPERRYRPTTRLCIPLQTGGGFAMALFMWGCFWMPALVVAVFGLLLLVLGHWVVGPILALVGAFFMGAFWSFPRDVWVARPCDLELDAEGFRVVGGHHAGTRLGWDELDAAASGVRAAPTVFASVLFAATRDGRELPIAEGDEHESFAAVLDAWRASAGLEPKGGDPQATKQPKRGKRKRQRAEAEGEAPAHAVTVQLVACGRCGAPACPGDAASVPCLYCGEAVSMPESLRARLRELETQAALQAKSLEVLERLLAQPRAPLTLAALALLGVAMLAAWVFGSVVFTRALLAQTVDPALVVYALGAPLLLTLVLSTLASLIAVRRVAVRAVTVQFAAIAPAEPGKPCSCRVCGAPLPQLDRPVLACAYCASSNVVSTARPRPPSRVRDHLKSLEETLGAQSAEQIVRFIFVALVGLPALWGAVGALRQLWSRLG